jgi:hypothetical protein
MKGSACSAASSPAASRTARSAELDDFPGITAGAWQMRPLSRGYVEARSPNPAEGTLWRRCHFQCIGIQCTGVPLRLLDCPDHHHSLELGVRSSFREPRTASPGRVSIASAKRRSSAGGFHPRASLACGRRCPHVAVFRAPRYKTCVGDPVLGGITLRPRCLMICSSLNRPLRIVRLPLTDPRF